jgi:hypothetical protein
VAHFLGHDGYVETAKAFAEEIRREKQSLSNALQANTPTVAGRDDTDAVHRQSKLAQLFLQMAMLTIQGYGVPFSPGILMKLSKSQMSNFPLSSQEIRT